MKLSIVFVVLLVITALLAWSPWITKEYAEQKAMEEFVSSWEGTIDGCGFSCEGCGVKGSQRTLFGYSVTVGFGCGMKPGIQTDEIFVSVLGTVHSSSIHSK